jgi:hypothetical protein
MDVRDPRSRSWLSGYWVGVLTGIVGMLWKPPWWLALGLIVIGSIGWAMYAQDWWDWRRESRNRDE